MNLSRRNKLIVIISAVIILFVIIPIIIFAVNNSNQSGSVGDKTVIIENQNSYNRGVDGQTFLSIGVSTYAVMGLNIAELDTVYYGTIRNDSFQKTDTGISFILDIPSAKMSWIIGQSIDQDGVGRSDALVACIDDDRAIYPLFGCKDRGTGTITEDPAKILFYEVLKSLPLSGPTYNITFTASKVTPGNNALLISFYSAAGKQDALNALTSLGYNPDDYEIMYSDESVAPIVVPVDSLD